MRYAPLVHAAAALSIGISVEEDMAMVAAKAKRAEEAERQPPTPVYSSQRPGVRLNRSRKWANVETYGQGRAISPSTKPVR